MATNEEERRRSIGQDPSGSRIAVPSQQQRQARALQTEDNRRRVGEGIADIGRRLAGGAGSPLDTRNMPRQARNTVDHWRANPPEPDRSFRASPGQRRLVSQAVNEAVPRAPGGGAPPTQGGEGHAATDQLPNAPRPEAPPAPANAPARQPAFNDGAGATYTTGTGRTGNLPAGIAVDYREDGTPVFTNSPGSAAAVAAQPGQAQESPMAAVQRMLASTADAPQQVQQAGGRRLSRRATEPVTGEARRLASMRRNDLAWDMRRMGRGSPSTRRGLMDAYMQEQRLGADALQAQANRDNQVDIAAMGHQAQATEGAANRRLTATGQMLTAAQQMEQANQPSRTLTAEDGTVSVLRNDGTVQQLMGPEGEPFRAAPTRGEGAVTPAIQFQALNTQLTTALQNHALNPTNESQQQVDQIRAQMAALAGGQVSHGAPSQPPAEAIAQLRSNPDAAAQFDEIFGPGAAARYLGN